MATRLYTTCTPSQAFSILTSGVYTPRSMLPMDPNAAMTLFCCDMAGEPLALRPGAELSDGGVGVVLDWLGEEERLEGWGNGPSPNILYHEYQAHELSTEPAYVRSLVTAGTRINLRVKGLVFEPRSLRHHLQHKRIPSDILPPRWRSMSKRINDVADKLLELVPEIGMPIRLDGPSLELRLIHERYEHATQNDLQAREQLFQRGTPTDIKPQKVRDDDQCPEVYDVAGHLLRQFNIPIVLGNGEAFSLIPHTALFKDAYALSSLGPQAYGSGAQATMLSSPQVA